MMKALATRMAGMAAALSLAGGVAHAVPLYTSGSLSFSGTTDVVGSENVTTVTYFPLVGNDVVVNGSAGSMSLVTLPATLSLTGAANFGSAGSFTFTNSGLGTFTATSDFRQSVTPSGPNASATWDVLGTFTLGSDWSNAGTGLSASETWGVTQTGGIGTAISIGGTFNSPSAVTPEPATLALLGVGLAGVGLLRRRRQTKD